MGKDSVIDDLDRPEDEDFTDEHGEKVTDDEKISDEDFSRGGKGGSDKGDAARRQAEDEEKAREAAKSAKKDDEKDAEEADEEDEEDKIPLAAHLAERRRWEAKEEALQRQLAEARKPAEPDKTEEQPPDYATDPKGYIDFQVKKLAAQAENAGKSAEQLAHEAKAAGEYSAFMNDLMAKESSFRQSHADYDAALAHVRTVRAEQILLANPQATEAEVIQAIRSEELSAAQALMKRGQNPIEYAYKFAKTIGYKAAALPDTKKKEDDKAAGPDLSLSQTSGAAPDDDEDAGDDKDVFEEALAERFGKRR